MARFGDHPVSAHLNLQHGRRNKMKPNVKYSQQLGAERPIAPFIPYSTHITDSLVMTKEGDFIATWKVDGISHETADPDLVQSRLEKLNMLYRSIGSSQVAFWSHQIHRKISDRLVANFDTRFARDLDKKYYDTIGQHAMMANEIYISLVYRPYATSTAKSLGRAQRQPSRMKEFIREQVVKVEELVNQIEASMRHYGLERMGVYQDKLDNRCSTMLELFNFLISGYWQKVQVPNIPLYDYLGTSWVFSGTETIEIRSPSRVRYARGIDFKEYNNSTQAGILNELMYVDFEYVITHSFSCMSKRDGKDFLERQQKQLMSSDDGAAQQVGDMTAAIMLLADGQFVMGQYHFSLLVFDDSIEAVAKRTSEAVTIIQDMGFLASIITTATEAAFYAQLPANWFYRPRIARITSRNFCGLCSFHNFAAGKRDNNPWGQAVTMMQTPAGQPYYVNFHATKIDEDSFDKKTLANTRLIGQSGSGKTALMTFLASQTLKYATNSPTGFSLIYFDIDRGAEIFVRTNNGRYFAFQDGKPSGMNPFQMEPTDANIEFLNNLIKKLATQGDKTISTMDETRIDKAIRTVMRMDKPIRSITVLCQNITEGTTKEEKEDSIIKRLAKWCEGGQYAWVFDNPSDNIDFTSSNLIGFDGTAFLHNETTCVPVSMYLLHRTESVIDGRRFIYIMDECQEWVSDDTFSEFADKKQVRIRKQNGLGIFATQMPSKLLKSPVAASLVQQVATEIYLPNPKADRGEYINGFKVTEAEFEIIKTLDPESRMFLIKQGHSSALVRFDLAGFDDEMAVLSGSTDNIELLEEIMREVGEDPEDWYDIFQEKRKARRVTSKSIKRS
jgi:type IV secretion system protein VirB4